MLGMITGILPGAVFFWLVISGLLGYYFASHFLLTGKAA